MNRFKLVLAVVAATALLGMLALTASAGKLSSTTQSWTATFASFELGGLFGTTSCAVTLEGSLHSRTIAKTAGLLIGFITRARVGTCLSGAQPILTETLPWHVQYGSFAGTLPNITSFTVNIIGWSQRIRETGGITCLIRSTAGEPARGIFNRSTSTGAVTAVTIGGSIRTGAECFGARATLGGTSNSITAHTVTLI